MLSFRERLKELIDTLGLTAARFSELHGVSQVSMSKMLSGDTKPSLDTIEKICLANPKISAEFLIRGVGFPLIDEKLKEPADTNETLRTIFEIQAHINSFLVDKTKEVTLTPEQKERQKRKAMEEDFSRREFNVGVVK